MATKFFQWIAGVLKRLVDITVKKIKIDMLNKTNSNNIGTHVEEMDINIEKVEIKIDKLVIADKELVKELMGELLTGSLHSLVTPQNETPTIETNHV